MKWVKSCSFFLSMLVLANIAVLQVYAEDFEGGAEIEFQGTDQNLGPLDPEKQVPVDPGEIAKTEGSLRIDFAPQLTFETKEITKNGIDAFAHAQLFKDGTDPRENFIQVSDYRDTPSGWSLIVRQEQQFQHETKGDNQLKGATISFDKSWTNSLMDASIAPKVSKNVIQMNNVGQSYPLAEADSGSGMGTWSILFGASPDNEQGKASTLEPLTDAAGRPVVDAAYEGQQVYRNTAIQLNIPETDKLEDGNYSTVLTWIIAELP